MKYFCLFIDSTGHSCGSTYIDACDLTEAQQQAAELMRGETSAAGYEVWDGTKLLFSAGTPIRRKKSEVKSSGEKCEQAPGIHVACDNDPAPQFT